MSSSTTTAKPTKAAILAQLQALVSGLQKQLPNGTFTLSSTEYTTATLVQGIQALITMFTAVDSAQASAKDAMVAYEAGNTKMAPILSALKRAIRVMYANSPATLALFGLKPPKAPTPLTAAQLAAKAAKAAATRAARGTTSKKQKASISGNVASVTIISNVTPAPVPASGTSPAAVQQVATTPVASPPGHVGQ
jgi:hypothetical protein